MDELGLPEQSPLFHAENADRYARQELIQTYEQRFDCRFIVMIDAIFPYSIALFEELIYDADPKQALHLLLASPGGDGESAVRLARSAQARCSELTVIVPDQAKSAATILVMGAHRILMGPTSDLGPVDPQFPIENDLVSAKDIIAAVEAAESAVEKKPDSYPLHASLLAQVDALLVQRARSELARTEDLVEEALKSNPARTEEEVASLKKSLKKPLIELPKSHAAIFGGADAKNAGLPVDELDPQSEQWQIIWRLYGKYLVVRGSVRGIYEGQRASKLIPYQS